MACKCKCKGMHWAGEGGQRRGGGKRKEVEGDTEVEGDIFSERSVGPWQFCHACFSQDLCPAVPPFKRRLLPSTVIIAPTPGAVPRRSTSYRPITVWPFRLHMKFQRQARLKGKLRDDDDNNDARMPALLSTSRRITTARHAEHYVATN